MDTYDGRCGSCVHMNINDYRSSKHICYCTERGRYYSIDESISGCSRYEYAKNRDYYSLSRRWYVVTEICRRLGLTHECEYVSRLFSFREDVLEGDPKYELFLKDYDILGPFLASLIKHDNDSQKVCENLFKLYLSKISCLIMDGKNEEALEAYIGMLATLKDIYGIELVRKNSSIMIKM